MRAAVQRIGSASVKVGDRIGAVVGPGLLVYLGVGKDDETADADYLAEKIAGLRIFRDEADKMNLSVIDTGGEVLVISAFTTQGDARKGRRPSFDAAAPPEHANVLYEHFCNALVGKGPTVARGVFGAHMHVESVNDGPICLIIDSKRAF